MGLAQSPQPSSRFSGDNDEELLVYMSLRAEDPNAAEDAWAEFYNRHVGYIYARCRKAYARTLGDLGVTDLVHDIFVRAFEKAATFEGRGDNDLAAIRYRVRGWLGKIGNRLVLDILRGPREEGLPEPELIAPQPDEQDQEFRVSPRVVLIREALHLLTEREIQVLRVTGEWYQPGRVQQRVSKKDMDELAKRLQTTVFNIRQIRKRAIDKVREYVRSHEQPGK